MIQYKVDILTALKDAGYSTHRLRQDKLMGEYTIQQIRTGQLVSWANINRICTMLDCQPGDFIEFVPDK